MTAQWRALLYSTAARNGSSVSDNRRLRHDFPLHSQVFSVEVIHLDSGGGAGIQADLKTFQALACYGTSVITSCTAQNTKGVHDVEGVSPRMVSAQIEAVLSDIGANAIKIGMVFNAAIVGAIVESLAAHPNLPSIVLDPVMVATSGHTLLEHDAIDVLRTKLLPLCHIITPNIPEAQILASWAGNERITDVDSMRRCAEDLGKLGCNWVYIKGGHLPFHIDGVKSVVDLLWDSSTKQEVIFKRPHQESQNTHGTGCTLSAAIAAELAKSIPVTEAVKNAADYVADAIATAYKVGSGIGPVNHAHRLLIAPTTRPTLNDPYPLSRLLILRAGDAWERYVHHPFPNALAKGNASKASFLFFLKQDYHFLVQYARTNALISYKIPRISDMSGTMVIHDAIVKETEVHIKKCEENGIPRAELLNTPISVTNMAYSKYVLDVCASDDLLAARVATSPCLFGYGEVGERLLKATENVDKSAANPYWYWIEDYGSKWFQDAVTTGKALLETMIQTTPISQQRFEELVLIFIKATELEIAFWDEAMQAAR